VFQTGAGGADTSRGEQRERSHSADTGGRETTQTPAGAGSLRGGGTTQAPAAGHTTGGRSHDSGHMVQITCMSVYLG